VADRTDRARRGSRPLAALAALALLLSATLASTAPAMADVASQCATPTRTLSPEATSVSVAAGETLLVASSFSGGVDALPAGATLCVGDGATLTVSYMNNAAGSLLVADGATLDLPSVVVASGFTLEVEGTATAAGLNSNGSSRFHVASGGFLTVEGTLAPAAGTISNDGVLIVDGALDVNTSVSFRASGVTSIRGAVVASGPVENTGLLDVTQTFTLNGSGSLDNSCVVVTGADLVNDSASAVNSGIVTIAGTMTNNGTWQQPVTGATRADGLRDDGSVLGAGRYLFSGPTSVQGSFVGGSASDPVVVQTTAPAGQVFDVETGTVRNVVRGTVDLLEPFPTCGTAVDTPTADVVVSKEGPQTVEVGGTVEYVLTVANAGPGRADDVVATDALPDGFVLDPTSTDAALVDGSLTWSLGTLAAGESRELTFSGTVTAPAGSILVNTASSTSSTVDPGPTNNDGSAGSARVETEVLDALPPANLPPVADDLLLTGTTGSLVVGHVVVADPDAGQKLTVSSTGTAQHGRFFLAPGGGLVYLSDRDFAGRESIPYEVCDNASPVPACDSAVIVVDVAPRATDDTASTVVDRAVTVPVLQNDTAGAPLDPVLTAPAAHGAVVLDPARGTATYTPGPGYLGDDTFDYRICSPTVPDLCAVATVRVEVLPATAPPVVEPLTLVTVVERPVAGQVVASDPDGAVLTDLDGVPPRSGDARTTADGVTTYTPRPGFAGRDAYTVLVCDDGDPVLCATGDVSVEVFPVARDDSATTPAGQPVVVDVAADDEGLVDPPAVTSDPGHGEATVVDGGVSYTPDPGFVGEDSLVYTVCAVGEPDLCASATVTITVVGDAEPTAPPTEAPTDPPTSAPPSDPPVTDPPPTDAIPVPPTQPPAGGQPGGGADQDGPRPSAGLARTGSDLWQLGAAALVLVGGGAMVLAVLARRRGARSASD